MMVDNWFRVGQTWRFCKNSDFACISAVADHSRVRQERQRCLASLGGSDRLTLASAAAKQWTGGFNPRELATAGYADLYDSALGPMAQGVKG